MTGIKLEMLSVLEVKEGDKVVFSTDNEKCEEMWVSIAGKKRGPIKSWWRIEDQRMKHGSPMDLEDMDKVGRLNQKKTKDKANIVYSKDEEVIKEACPTVCRDWEETDKSRKESLTVRKGKAKQILMIGVIMKQIKK